MRKEYVKPVMESEEFVSNEYVAACYWVDCIHNNCIDPVKVKDVDSEAGALETFAENNRGTVATTEIDGVYIYKGELGGNLGVYSDKHNKNWGMLELLRQFILILLGIEDGDMGYHHDLSVWKTTVDNNNGHPNASA